MILQHIEEAADRIVISAKINTWPVSPETCAQHLNVSLQKMALEDGFVGMFILKENKPYIIFNKDEDSVTSRFTIAHELGHYVLHSADVPLFIDKGEKLVYQCYKNFSETELREREANAFAAALLMPKTFIERALNEAAGVAISNIIQHLADKFEVSHDAMSIRLSNLGVVEYGIVA